jgi:hypothetical protein
MEKAKDPAAVSLGKRGGLARLRKMTARQRSQAARHAVTVRWAKAKQAKAKRAKVKRRPGASKTVDIAGRPSRGR